MQDKIVLSMNFPVDVSFISEPVVSPEGKVIAMEVLSRFFLPEKEGGVLFPSEFLFRRASRKEKIILFMRQIEAVSGQALFFNENEVCCTINADRDIAGMICNSPEIKIQLISMPFIRLEISETFSEMNGASTDPLLSALSNDFGLWLDDFGTGNANLAALQCGLFDTVKIDKTFFWAQADKPLWPVILRELRRHVSAVVVEGVENQVQIGQLAHAVEGMQGYFFPAVPLQSPESALEHALLACTDTLDGIEGAVRSGSETP